MKMKRNILWQLDSLKNDVEMEGVGLFTIAKYRDCVATAIYIVSDVPEDSWNLGWGEDVFEKSEQQVIDLIINLVRNF